MKVQIKENEQKLYMEKIQKIALYFFHLLEKT